MTPEELKKAIQFAYCCDYDKYLKVFEHQDAEYAFGKWKDMQKNFGGWYCDLDSNNADLFVNAVLSKE